MRCTAPTRPPSCPTRALPARLDPPIERRVNPSACAGRRSPSILHVSLHAASAPASSVLGACHHFPLAHPHTTIPTINTSESCAYLRLLNIWWRCQPALSCLMHLRHQFLDSTARTLVRAMTSLNSSNHRLGTLRESSSR